MEIPIDRKSMANEILINKIEAGVILDLPRLRKLNSGVGGHPKCLMGIIGIRIVIGKTEAGGRTP